MRVTATKTINGYWECMTIYNGYLVRRTYIGYTKKRAITLFKEEVKRK